MSIILAWLTLFSQQSRTAQREVQTPPILFRWDNPHHDATYRQNRAAADSIFLMLKRIGPENLDYVEFTAYASPEGGYRRNMELSRLRAAEVRWLVRKNAPELAPKLRIRAGGEGWSLLRARVQSDKRISAKSRERILRILDAKGISNETRKWRMVNWLGSDPRVGDLWEYLLKTHYPHARSCTVTIRFAAEPGSPLASLGKPVSGEASDESGSAAAAVAVAPADSSAAAAASKTAEQGAPAATGDSQAQQASPADGSTTAAGGDTAEQGAPADTTGSSAKGAPAAFGDKAAAPADSSANAAPIDSTVAAVAPADSLDSSSTAADSTSASEGTPPEGRATRGTEAGGPSTDGGVSPKDELPQGESPSDANHRAIVPIIGVSTNLLYDLTYIPGYGLTSIPSLSLEYYPAGGHLTFGADVEWPNWTHPDDHRYLQIHNIGLWGRYYFKPVENRFRGWYAGGCLNATQYGIGWSNKGWEGEGLALSVLGGHKWTFGRIYIDAGLALGVFYSRFDSYTWGNDATGWYYYDYIGDPEAFEPRSKRLLWFGPTRLQVSIGLDLFNRNRKKDK